MSRFGTSLVLVGTMLLTGCMVVGRLDDFEYDRDASHENGTFVPPSYIARQSHNVYLPFVWLFVDQLPHDLAILKFDHTYTQTSNGFETIVIESLQIERAGEPPVDLISSTEPLEKRTHKIPRGKEQIGENARILFKGAITSREPFTILMRGYAIDKQGQPHPFEDRKVYQFKESRWTWGPHGA
jgi:hypothetical protein